jgi:hypothetical protein
MAKETKSQLPEIPPLPDEMIAQRFPNGFTTRDEANALTAYAFRNGALEDLHAGKSSPLLDDQSLSRISEDEMRQLMITASEQLAQLLEFRSKSPDDYTRFLQEYNVFYCSSWTR